VKPESLFILVVYTQWLFWAWLFNTKRQWTYWLDRLEPAFNPVALITVLAVGFYDFNYSAYKEHHFIIYVGLCVFAVSYLRAGNKYRFKDALSLGFLLVFCNSFVWEFPIHFAEWASLAWTPLRLARWSLQLVHVLTIVWLWTQWEFTKPREFYTARLGVAWFYTSTAWTVWQYCYWTLGWPVLWWGSPLMIIARFISLIMVLSIFNEGGHPTKSHWFPR